MKRPCWRTVNDEALREPALTARVMAAMFDSYGGSVPRGSLLFWQPDYLRVPSAASVAQWFPRRDAGVRADCIRAYVAGRRAEVAQVNRSLRHSEVHLAWNAADPSLYLVDSYQGDWRDISGAQRGNDLLSLGMLRWSCRYGQAGSRIAKIIGIEVPLIERTPHAA